MAKTYSFRATDEEEKYIEAHAAEKGTATDVLREALKLYRTQERQAAYGQRVLYEIAKTRAVLLRCFDMAGKELSAELLAEAGKDAEAYLQAATDSPALTAADAEEPRKASAPAASTSTLRLRRVS